jgi:hypothetical protein
MNKTAINILKWAGVVIIIIIALLVAPEMEAQTKYVDGRETLKSALTTIIMAALAISFTAIVIREFIKKRFKK